MPDIAVIDYGMGNLRSVSKAIEHVAPGLEVVVTSDPATVARAARVVFPGQGAMPDCMREMDARGLREAVLDAAWNKPFLGICIGLQMLFERSEGAVAGGRRRAPAAAAMVDASGARLKVPHMGWNRVRQVAAHPPGGILTVAVLLRTAIIATAAPTRGTSEYPMHLLRDCADNALRCSSTPKAPPPVCAARDRAVAARNSVRAPAAAGRGRGG